MKFAILAVAAGAALMTGCDTNMLISLDPFVTPERAVFEPGLVGAWGAADDSDLCIIRKSGDTGYKITYLFDKGTVQFDAFAVPRRRHDRDGSDAVGHRRFRHRSRVAFSIAS